MAFLSGISFAKAAINVTSEESGKIVAARNAEKKSANSCIKFYALNDSIFSIVSAISFSLASTDVQAMCGVT